MKDESGNPSMVLHGIRDLRAENRPIPLPGTGQVQVRIRSVGICGSDVHYYEHGRIGGFVVREPMILGHESSGVVTSVGDGVEPARIGQRVALEPGVPCGRCLECRTGRYNLCRDVRFLATPPVDGTLALYVALDAAFAHPIPDGLSDDAGALIEPLAVAVWANRKAGTAPGDRVLVTGAGPIGVLCALVARECGADVAVADINRERLAQATRLGAGRAVDVRSESDLRKVRPTVVLECTGSADVVGTTVAALEPAGRAVLVGMGSDDAQPLPTAQIQAKELAVTGTFRYANCYPGAIALAAAGRVDLDQLIGARLPLSRAEEALNMSRTNPDVLKTIVTPDNDLSP